MVKVPFWILRCLHSPDQRNYKKNPIRALEAQTWPGVICQPFAFERASWTGAESGS